MPEVLKQKNFIKNSFCFLAVGQEFINYFMTEINKYRRMHSAIPLTWSLELSMKAQQWAEYLANEDKYGPSII